MNLYEVMPVVAGGSHMVIANNEREAIGMIVDYVNYGNTSHHYDMSDFCANEIHVDSLYEPMIIN